LQEERQAVSAEETRPSISIKVGSSIITLRGTLVQIRKDLLAVAGLSDAKDKTLAELVVEADIHVNGVWTAASMVGFQPNQEVEERGRSLPPKGTTTDRFRQSIADKAAEADAETAEPSDYTDDVTELIRTATSRKGLTDIRDKVGKDNWNEAHQVAAAARWNELEA
jgi:hypothetical protein